MLLHFPSIASLFLYCETSLNPVKSLIKKPLLATLWRKTMTDWVIYVMLFPPYYLTKGSQMHGKDATQGKKDIRNITTHQ